ncbi:hypothetical protein OSB04_006967 [Centaurea solstitialis]|uniref:Uncharacterized protein n=1 Tax=Centaurea solstitialis TaxID=347529 RepID=A0AA38U280_9ASTR|nr:hypothetical protein OSB04_006967 [Centaurea solstitialis]
METPLSSRRITRSQAKAMASENTIPISSRGENEESKSRQKSKHQEREKLSALIDITNGSPIVGLAMGCLKTPSSTCSKNKRMMIQNSQSKQGLRTPGSGESILRGQVKTLLQKVEEEGVISKISFEHNPLIHKRFINSPIAVLAPTPANTPQVYDFSTNNNNNVSGAFVVSPVAENFSFSQMLNEIIIDPNQEEKSESDEKIVITRSLFVDFSENFEGCDSPVEGSDASVWSVQVNASTSEEYKDEEEDYEDGDDVVVDELCEGMSKISVKNDDAKFIGKHIRFVYNSDGELEDEIESSSSSSKIGCGMLCLKGLATPEGKHLRFPEENESEEEETRV